MWCWRRMEKIGWLIAWKNSKYYRQYNRQYPIDKKWRTANCIGHNLRRKCLLKYVFKRNSEGMRRRGRRRKMLLADLKKNRKYWNLKEVTIDRTLGNSIWKRLRTCRKTDYAMNSVSRPTTASKFVEKVRLLLGQYYVSSSVHQAAFQ
jgi:hypothetical protein